MSTRIARNQFLSRLRNQTLGASAPPRKVVNEKLEAMLESMMSDAASVDSKLTFDQKMAIGSLVLKMEAIRNRIQDEDYGTGFTEELGEETIVEPAEADKPDE